MHLSYVYPGIAGARWNAILLFHDSMTLKLVELRSCLAKEPIYVGLRICLCISPSSVSNLTLVTLAPHEGTTDVFRCTIQLILYLIKPSVVLGICTAGP